MKLLVALVALVLVGCGVRPLPPSYEELAKFRKSCSNQVAELKLLQGWQSDKHFDSDPDNLNEEDRKYNSLLKSIIWWYTIECNNEKSSGPVIPD